MKNLFSQRWVSLLVAALLGALLASLIFLLAGHGHDEEGHGHEAGAHAHNESGSHDEGDGHEHGEGDEGHGDEESHGVTLTDAQLAAAGIRIETAAVAPFADVLTLPGQLVLNADREARVLAGVNGVVRSLPVQVGDRVKAGAVLATLDSREFAEASAALLAARERLTLAEATFSREQGLWEKKISAEQDFLAARRDLNEARIEADSAVQKLRALGVSADDVKRWKAGSSNGYVLRAPLAGTVLSRDLTLGESLPPEKTVFRIADLSSLWVDLAVPATEMAGIKAGQAVRILSPGSGALRESVGHVLFVQPELDAISRSASVRVSLENREGQWRAGEFIRAELQRGGGETVLSVPASAVLTQNGETQLFVQKGSTFEPRVVKTGRRNGSRIEILSGMKAGERYASGEVFLLKAEMGKSEADHAH